MIKKMMFVMVSGLVLMFTSCGNQHKAQSLVKDFLDENLVDQDCSYERFSHLTPTAMISFDQMKVMRQNVSKLPYVKKNIDYNDAAWGWAPGVQEKVIAEVISRGYVVEGGYTLVPKYIENGEGFYDLYATTNSKIFPKSKPEEFPLYVVTINAKTGWFKGNGPN